MYNLWHLCLCFTFCSFLFSIRKMVTKQYVFPTHCLQLSCKFTLGLLNIQVAMKDCSKDQVKIWLYKWCEQAKSETSPLQVAKTILKAASKCPTKMPHHFDPFWVGGDSSTKTPKRLPFNCLSWPWSTDLQGNGTWCWHSTGYTPGKQQGFQRWKKNTERFPLKIKVS